MTPHSRGDAGEPAFVLLCRAVQPNPDLVYVKAVIGKGVDETLLLRLAEMHRVRPHLIQCLSALAWYGVPAQVRETLEDFRRRHLRRVLSIADEILGVAEALDGAGISFVAFKGPALALQLYGDLARREYADVDIIVPTDQVKRADEVLAARGYRNLQGDWAFRWAFLRHQRQYALSREGIDAAIDLHWDFSPAPLPFPLRAQDVWARAGSVELGGRGIPAVAGEDLALLLAGHGAKEGWRSLGWVCDFAMLVERASGLDWSAIHQRARRNGCGDTVLLACALADELLQTPVPGALSLAVERSRRVRSITAELSERLRTTMADETARRPLEDALLCDRRRDRLKAWIRLGLTPTPGDYQWMPLPRPLWPVYYLTRPVRLLTTSTRSLVQRGGDSRYSAATASR